MEYKELEPLLDKVVELQSNEGASDIYDFVFHKIEIAKTPSMAQSACEHVITMCHPRAWGDRYVDGYDDLSGWCNYLTELRDIAQTCWNEISNNNGAKPL